MLVTGPRQVGKTTFLQHISEKNRAYVTLDNPMACALARRDPSLFLQRFAPPLLIDEIQYAPELLPYIKMAVDRNRRPGMFWLTGSQQFQLMKGVSESLAGRVGIVNMLGLSREELLAEGKKMDVFLPTEKEVSKRLAVRSGLPLKELFNYIWRGAFPAIAAHKETDWNLFYSSYVQTYLQRDIHDLAHVGSEMAFLRFLRTAAARTGQLLNLSELARDADIVPNTAKSWVSILQASGIVYLLEPWHTNITKRLVKMPKLYFLDTGLCSFLTEWSSADALEAGAMSGAILETWILAEILKSYWHNGRKAPLYFYRDKDKKEVDFLIVRDGAFYPLEVKKTASPSAHDARNFGALKKLSMPLASGGVICLTETNLPLAENIQAIPVSVL
jgi:predicted AAA+ superfamily ATPase